MTLNITPGPWTWEYDPWRETATVTGADGDAVAQVRGNLGYDVLPEDNARLIAAAPDMLEALIEADYTICKLCRVINPQHIDCTTCSDAERLRKTIEKATGKTWEEIKNEMAD